MEKKTSQRFPLLRQFFDVTGKPLSAQEIRELSKEDRIELSNAIAKQWNVTIIE